jgi:multidrug resistance efflux pump
MSQDTNPSPPPPAAWTLIHPPLWLRGIFVAVGIIAILMILWAWDLPPFSFWQERTDDAYVEGYTTVIAPQVAGYLSEIDVLDFEEVPAGKVLAEIDHRPFQQRVEEARATLDAKKAALVNNRQRLAQAKAQVRIQDAAILSAAAKRLQASRYAQRSTELVEQGALSHREREADEAALSETDAALQEARATRDSALEEVKAIEVNEGLLKADVEGAEAQLHSAEIDLGYTTLSAPQDGVLSAVGGRVGQYVSAGTPIMFLVPKERWIIANYKESQTHHMEPGQPAWFTVDALGGEHLQGHLERIAPATGAQFSALKPDNATGNFTKVPQRIPVRIAIDHGQPLSERLRPGMSVEVHVDISEGAASAPRIQK